MPQPNEYMLKRSQAEIEYQKKLTAGTNITIDPVTNTISSAGGGSTVSYESNYTLGDILGRININGTSNAIRLDLRAGDNINIVRDVTTGALVISSTGGSGTITDVVQENESVVEDGIAYTEKNHIILDEDGSLPTPAIGNDYDFYASKMERIDPEVTFVKSLVWSDNNDITETSDHVYSYSMTGTSDGRAEMATYSITNLEVGATYQLKFVEQISSSATFYNQHPYGTCISEDEDGTGQTKSGDPGTYDPTLRFFSYYRDTDEHEYVCTFEATQETMYLVTVFGDVYDGTSNTVSFSNLTVTKVKPEITDLWFKIPTTGWLKFYGTNSAATSVHILNSRAEWDALPDSKYTDNVIYVIKGEGGRQSVIANPTGPATNTLVTIGIDGIVYNIAGGGGGGGSSSYTETTLWENASGEAFKPNDSKTVTLSDSLSNYDAISFVFGGSTNANAKATFLVLVSDFVNYSTEGVLGICVRGSINYNPVTYYVDNTHITFGGWTNSETAYAYKVVGVKFGGGGGGEGNAIGYGIVNPTRSGSDGDIYYLLNGQGKKRALFLYEINQWVCIEGSPKGTGFAKVYSDAYNTDSSDSRTITIDDTQVESGATASNFYKNLTALFFSGSSSYETTTNFTGFSTDQLTYSWGEQSGSTQQWFDVMYLANEEDINVLSNWTTYTQSDTYTFNIPEQAQGLTADDFIIDFRNVKSGGNSMSKTSVTKTVSNGVLSVYLPVGGRGYDVRIIYTV